MNPAAAPNSSESPFPGFPTLDIGGMFRAIRKRAWIIAVSFGICVTLALVYVLVLASKLYESQAVVYVEPSRERVFDQSIQQVRADDFRGLDALKSLEQSMVSGSVILRVVEKHDLLKDPDFLGPAKNGHRPADAEIVETISRRVKATLQRGTRLITLKVTDKSPERAQLLANAFVEEFESLLIEQNLDSSKRAQQILKEQSEEQLDRVNQIEDKLQAFRQAHSSVPLEEGKGNVVESRLSDLDRMLSKAANEKLLLQSQAEMLETLPKDDPERILEIGDFVKQEHIGKLLLARNQKKAEFNKIKRQFKPQHQTYIAFESEIVGLDQQVREVAMEVGKSIRQRYITALEHEQKLKKTVEEQKSQVLALDGVRKEYRAMKHALDAAYDTYHKLLARINETDVTDGVKESHIRRFQEPLVPAKPAKPKKKLTVGLAGIFGIFLGCAIVLLWHLLDRSLQTRRQVEQTLGIPVLAEIAGSKEADAELNQSLLVFSDPHSLVAESFRDLRMALSSMGPRSVMFTSAMPDDGKSFCAVNLALLQAQLGYRTLLIDADFRRPSLARALIKPGTDTEIEAKNICQRTGFPNLFLISCGQLMPHTGEHMNGEHFASMLWQAYRSFDCVIIDSSPIGVVSDALSFANKVDAVALVVRSGISQTRDAQKACRELLRMRAPLVGCVLNGTFEPKRSKAYFESYNPMPQRPSLALETAPTHP